MPVRRKPIPYTNTDVARREAGRNAKVQIIRIPSGSTAKGLPARADLDLGTRSRRAGFLLWTRCRRLALVSCSLPPKLIRELQFPTAAVAELLCQRRAVRLKELDFAFGRVF